MPEEKSNFKSGQGRRELNVEEKETITEIVEDEFFKISSFESDVTSLEKFMKWHEQTSPTLESENG
ncbi:MAG: hypothetical protein U5K84_01370 [Alkalibacterium sp.]|nr:hypothetical protein [Alkalibacterium sp.]